MTTLSKPVKRLTASSIRDRGHNKRLVAILYPSGILGLRPERTRREEFIPLSIAYELAIRLRVRSEQAEKRKKKARGK